MSCDVSTTDRICAVIVTYHPQDQFPERLNLIRLQADALVIVDNTSGDAVPTMIKEQLAAPNVHLLTNEVNLGVATALNQGFGWAKDHGYAWVVTFDQDSWPPPEFVPSLRTAYELGSHNQRVAVVGSRYRDPVTAREYPSARSVNDEPWTEVQAVITSGSLFRVATYETLGPFRDEFFVDFIDTEYCLRARAAGYKILLTTQPLLIHRCGATSLHNLPWKRTGTSNHPPMRRYFMMRNHVVLAREYFRREPAWTIRTLVERLKSTALMCLFERDRFAKLRWSALGFVDGIAGRFGRVLN